MSDMFEVVDSLPSGRAGRHQEILDAFMKTERQYVKLNDPAGVRTNTLTLLANQQELPIKVHKVNNEIYLERTDWNHLENRT